MTWHPLLAAHEVEPGHWVMLDGLDEPYGEIRFVKRGDELGYRADRRSADRPSAAQVELVGYFRSVRTAAFEIHAQFIQSHGAPVSREYGR